MPVAARTFPRSKKRKSDNERPYHTVAVAESLLVKLLTLSVYGRLDPLPAVCMDGTPCSQTEDTLPVGGLVCEQTWISVISGTRRIGLTLGASPQTDTSAEVSLTMEPEHNVGRFVRASQRECHPSERTWKTDYRRGTSLFHSVLIAPG